VEVYSFCDISSLFTQEHAYTYENSLEGIRLLRPESLQACSSFSRKGLADRDLIVGGRQSAFVK
jgi:hypothetical protein